jgi:hypothetical protein
MADTPEPVRPAHARAGPGDERRPVWLFALIALVAVATIGVGAYAAVRDDDDAADTGAGVTTDSGTIDGMPSDAETPEGVDSGVDVDATAPADPAATATAAPEPAPTPFAGLVDPASVGRPYGDTVEGLLTFRGNPTRTYYGSGPVPASPALQWSYPPGGGLCGPSTVGGETTQWCGTGWTGQPAVFERDGRTWAVFGAYDHDVHFLDADTGEQILPPYPTNDIIKGSVTVDPDGFPLVYSGSRDDFFHVIAFDRDEPEALWRLDGNDIEGGLWNNDWDGSALVIDDYLFQGGENSIFYIVKLNRGYDDAGLVTVDPQVVFTAPGYDGDLLAAVGDNVSIENSVAISGNTVYFANSGGLVQGWRVGGLDRGRQPKRVFRYWVGDDVDASIVVDDEGFLYVGAEYERGNSRSLEVGQLVKLDPRKKNDPLVWSVFDTGNLPAGIWATPALHRDLVIAPTDSGRLLGVDRASGDIRWEIRLPGPLWSSPVVVDDVLLQGDCNGGLNAFDVSDTTVEPASLWTVSLTGCIESTPAVWDGRIIFGTRAGQVHMLGE